MRDLLVEKAGRFNLEASPETVIICALGHDLCKVNFYVEDKTPCTPEQYKYLNILAGQNNFVKPTHDILKNHASTLIDWLKNRPLDPVPELLPAYTVKD